jgi:hypothetical protein
MNKFLVFHYLIEKINLAINVFEGPMNFVAHSVRFVAIIADYIPPTPMGKFGTPKVLNGQCMYQRYR